MKIERNTITGLYTPTRRRFLAVLGALALTACAPNLQSPNAASLSEENLSADLAINSAMSNWKAFLKDTKKIDFSYGSVEQFSYKDLDKGGMLIGWNIKYDPQVRSGADYAKLVEIQGVKGLILSTKEITAADEKNNIKLKPGVKIKYVWRQSRFTGKFEIPEDKIWHDGSDDYDCTVKKDANNTECKPVLSINKPWTQGIDNIIFIQPV